MSNRQKRLVIIGAVLALILLCVGASLVSTFLARNYIVPSLTGTEPARLADETSSSEQSAEEGVLVIAVDPGSIAAGAGIQRGDVILRLNGRPVNTAVDWLRLLSAFGEGDTVDLTTLVEGQIEQVKFSMDVRAPYSGIRVIGRGETPSSDANPLPPPEIEATRDPPTPQSGRQDPFSDSRLNFPFQRPTISGIIDGSPADGVDLQPSDIITNVDDEAILNTDELVEAIGRHAPGDTIDLIYRRSSETLELSITLAPHPSNPEQGFLGVDLNSNQPVIEFNHPGIPDE